jgi:hypothetical protein
MSRLKVHIHTTLFVAVLCLLLTVPTFGATLEDHRDRVERALELAFEVEDSLRNGETGKDAITIFVAHVRNRFPATEKIEWQGGTIEHSNEWLRRKVDEFVRLEDSAEQMAAMTEIREYLSTIVFKLRELDNPPADTRTKDDDKQKLAEILRREEFQKPTASEESFLTRWFRQFWDWLESLFPRTRMPANAGSGMEALAYILQVIFYIGLAALLVLIVVKVVPYIFPTLKRKPRQKKKSRVILGEHIDEDQTGHDLFNEAERLAREGDLRGAIRKGYIALLCDLADRKVIGLARNKTNRDYLRDVRSRRELHPRMKAVTDTFERHWYGFQESAEHDWTKFRDDYREAIRNA